MTVPLPETGDGTRRRRRVERQRRGRRLGRRLGIGVVALAVVGAAAWVVVGLVTDDDDPTDTGTETSSTQATAPTASDLPPDLVVLAGPEGDVYGVTILAPATSTIVHVPPGTLVEIPSVGLASLADAEREGGDDLLQHSLENVLGVRFHEVLHLDPAGLAALVDDVGPLTVTVGDPVEDRTSTGRVTIVFPTGEQRIDATNVEAFLSVTGSGSALQRLVRHQAFWSALLAASDADGAPLASIGAMAGGEARQRVLPVEAVSGVEGDAELYRIAEEDLPALIALAFPDAATAGAERIRVRILNGAGSPGIAQVVQPLLVDAGAQVTLSGNADRFDYATTQVVYYDDASLEAARAIQEALGVGEVVKSLTELAVVDVTVVVGADFLAAHPEG